MATAAGAVFAIGVGTGVGLDAVSDIPGIYRLGSPDGRGTPPDDTGIVVVRVVPAIATAGPDPSRDAAM